MSMQINLQYYDSTIHVESCTMMPRWCVAQCCVNV